MCVCVCVCQQYTLCVCIHDVVCVCVNSILCVCVFMMCVCACVCVCVCVLYTVCLLWCSLSVPSCFVCVFALLWCLCVLRTDWLFFCSSPVVHRFGVAVLPGTKVETGPATLYLCNNLLVIARDVPLVIIGQWNLLDLRRYAAVTNGFVFEGGTRCGFCEFLACC